MGRLDRFLPWTRKKAAAGEEVEQVRPLLSYQVANLQKKGKRDAQEDSFAFVNALDVTKIRENGLMAIVCDGIGGLEAGKQASEMAVRYITASFEQMTGTENLAGQLREAVLATDSALAQRFQGKAGTTVVTCILYEEKLYFASVGDSGIYLARDGSLYRLNREQNYRHQLYEKIIDAGEIDPTDANQNPDRHRLSAFLGMGDLTDLDGTRHPFPLHDKDVLLLCSDGVSGVLTETQLFRAMMAKSAAEGCAELDRAIQEIGREHQDNYTALILRCAY